MQSRGRNCNSLLRLKLIYRSPLWLGSNIVTFHPGGPILIPDIILIYTLFMIVKVIKKILNSCPTQDRVEGWDAMKPLYYRSVSSKGAGRPRLTHHHRGWWNGTKWMRWVWRNGGMKFVVGENGRNPAKNLPRPRFVHHETHMEWPRGELGTPAVGGGV